MIKRDFYLQKIIRNMWNGEVKVITGIRRCGKSVLLFELFLFHRIITLYYRLIEKLTKSIILLRH